MIDLIGAVALSVVSALVVFVYVYYLPLSNRRRAAIASLFAAWFALVATCGATGALDAVHGIGPAGMGVAVIVPFAVLTYASTRAGTLRESLGAIPLSVLIGVHAIRLLGVFFVLLYSASRLPAPFAPSAGWGDVLIGATALPVAYLTARKAPAWRFVALAWNALGLFDLVDAIALGVASSPGIPFALGHHGASSNLMTTLPWILIPSFLVPLLAHLHIVIFQQLRRPVVAGGQVRHVPRHS